MCAAIRRVVAGIRRVLVPAPVQAGTMARVRSAIVSLVVARQAYILAVW
jgi:hypothetical protein